MLCYPYEERRLTDPKFGWSFPLIIQPKLDGERCRIICRGTEPPIILSSTERRIFSVPHISKAIQEANLTDLELDGELYLHGETFETISGIVSRTENLHPDHEQMEFHCFDIINKQSQIERSLYLMQDLPDIKYIKKVDFQVITELKDIPVFFDLYLDLGYEGIIFRHLKASYERKRSRFIMKFKPKKTDIYRILSVIEGSGEHTQMVGAFLCAGNDETVFKVAAGEFTYAQRAAIWEMRKAVINNYLKISYQNITAHGVPRFGLAKQIIQAPEQNEYESIL